MANKKKKNKKKKKLKKVFFLVAFLLCLIVFIIYLLHAPIKNIYVTGNKIVSDKEIITLSEIDNYPPFINTYLTDIKSNVSKNKYIKDVKVTRSILGKVYIKVTEYKPICLYQNKLVLSSKEKVDNEYNINYVPYVTGNIDPIYDKFVDKFKNIDIDVLLKISEISYVPNDVDKERFLLYMSDHNYVYITLSKTEKINKYNTIVGELNGKKGIVYLDLGDYVEIKIDNN